MARTELTMSEEEFALKQIKTDEKDGISRQVYEYLKKLAKGWGVDITNIAWIGQKPYPMQGGLFQMLKNKCEKEGLVVSGILPKSMVRAEHNSKRAGVECTITLFDQRTFESVMAKSPIHQIPVESVRELKAMLTHTYHEEGWASLETVKAPALQNPDYLNHLASTRAIDRTLRIIVRCPFTAESELPSGSPASDLPGTFTPPADGVPEAQSAKPGGAAMPPSPEVKPATPEAAPIVRPGGGGPKNVPQGEIKKIDAQKAEKKVDAKQVNLAAIQWSSYCKAAVLGMKPEEIESKREKLLRALFGKTKFEELSVAELEEFIGMLTRKEIEVTPDNPEPHQEGAIKT